MTSPLGLRFEWDIRKSSANVRKHRVPFEEAATCFGDPLSITIPDPLHSGDETRFVLIGRSHRGRILVVVHAERGDNIRIISARKAARGELRDYEEE